MYRSGRNPLKKVTRDASPVGTVRGARQRRLHKAFLRYHDPDNWPLLREALKQMGRADLIGNGKRHLVPNFQPPGTGRGQGREQGQGRGPASPGPRRQAPSPQCGRRLPR